MYADIKKFSPGSTEPAKYVVNLKDLKVTQSVTKVISYRVTCFVSRITDKTLIM